MKREHFIWVAVIFAIAVVLLFLCRTKKSYMHNEARDFTLYAKTTFPEFFKNEKKVLDIGSHGSTSQMLNNRFLFDDTCEYNGNDVVEGENVTIVSTTSELPFKDEYFDTIISTECFEHDMNYRESLKKIEKMLKPGGLFIFTCASTGRPEHGTLRTTPDQSLTTKYDTVPEWANYYKNLTVGDISECLNLDNFNPCAFYNNSNSHDLYFWGIKGKDNKYNFNHYTSEGVSLEFENGSNLTIITPCSRPENLEKIKESIDFDKIDKWYIVYDNRHFEFSKRYENNPKVVEIECKDEGVVGHQCRNKALDIIKSGMVYFLDDDNIIHPEFWNIDFQSGKIYTFNQQRSSSDILRGDNINVGKIDTAQFVFDKSLLNGLKFQKDIYEADGIFIQKLIEDNRTNWNFIDQIGCYYNKLKSL